MNLKRRKRIGGVLLAMTFSVSALQPAFAAVAYMPDVTAEMSKASFWAEYHDGYGDITFGASDEVTREQLAAILWRYAQYKGMDVSVREETNILSYNDAFDISEYAIPAMQWVCGAGILNGDDAGNLNPDGTAQKVHLAQLLMKLQKMGS